MHCWAYCKLTEKVDAEIAKILDALKESGDADNTVIIFTSDHGDMDSAHRMEHKTALYEEACKVPFIISQPDMIKKGVCSNKLISNGLDLFPTICDYAGITLSNDLQGKSVRPIVENKENDWRDTVYVESEFGNMIVTDRYKYAVYDEGKNNEQLYDLSVDPYETQNFAGIAEYQNILSKLRRKYKKKGTYQ